MMTVRDITYKGEGLIPAPLHGPALRYALLARGDVTDIAIHHWTGWTPPESWTAKEEIAYIVRIDEYHRTGRGLDGIGYQLAAFPSGRAYVVSRLDRYGGHVGGENNHLIGVGLPGDFDARPPSGKHLEAAREAVRYAYDYLGREVPTKPHLYWGGTTCPGSKWPLWVPQLQEEKEDKDMPLTQADKQDIDDIFVRRLRRHDDSYTLPKIAKLLARALASLPSGGSGPSEAQLIEALKQALREGTG